MNTSTQRLCAWTAPVILTMFFGGLLIAGFLPPLDPDQSAENLKQTFVDDQDRIRLGLLVCLLASGLLGPLVAVISVQLRRIEGAHSPMTYAQLVLGVFIPIVIMLPLSWWMTAAYRTDRDAQSIQVLSDQAWMLFVGAFYAIILQFTAIGIAIIKDTSEEPVFPRWLAYLNFWCAIGSLPAAGLYFVKDGPLAWNGILSWWLPASVFGIWMWAMFFMLLKAIEQQEEQNRPEPADPEVDRVARRVLELLDEQRMTKQS